MIVCNEKLKYRLETHVGSAISRNSVIDNILFYGEPGLGKTTLAKWISEISDRNICVVNSANVRNKSDIITLLKGLDEFDILFLDEIHRLNKSIEEILYSAIDDRIMTVFIGEGDFSQKIELDINQFTLIGATTEIENISNPLRSRFSIQEELSSYSTKDIIKILKYNLSKYDIIVNEDLLGNLARYTRGNPRATINMVKKIRDLHEASKKITLKEILLLLNLNKDGLTIQEQRYIDTIKNQYNGGPVSLRVLAISVGVSVSTLEKTIEPYLIKSGIVNITTKGRILI